ncbi:class F sortase [Kitasatospora sp. MMS16-BH015]|uniref:class F sortase n=1 Tax=Kitasatospora sp. MMS16-BH015 TaxID=2018025 RepID=UPI000CA374EC|nr:class F sortase [Kitasatospora sp. MMS16-BH015]AUG75354.1 class F sortase [Kitasatospora sp. MMS16-BH015]
MSTQRRLAVLAVAGGIALAGAGAAGLLEHPTTAAVAAPDIGTLPAPSHPPAPVPGHGTAGPLSGDPAPDRHAPPVRLRIPRIGVDTAVTDLQVEADGHLAAPATPDVAGWWSNGPAPGGPGNAVLVGHVDSLTGPAVFAGLSDLRPGDGIDVAEADGTTVPFTVRALRGFTKDNFPDDLVYGTTATPGLRLITCGGAYDHDTHEYLSNLVVFAEPTPPAPSTSSPQRRTS